MLRAEERLATAQAFSCRYDDAGDRYEAVIADLERRGDRGEALAIARHNLAELRRMQGRFGESRMLDEKALEHWERTDASLPASYPRTGLAFDDLAEGRWQSARDALVRELELRERLTGSRSVLSAEAVAGLGHALVNLGRRDEGIAALRRALAIYDEHGPGHRAARMLTAQWLGQAIASMDRDARESHRLFEEARAYWSACGDPAKVSELDALLSAR